MKNIIKSLMIGLAAVALLASCEDKKENVELDPYATNFVYLKAPLSSTYRATFSTGGVWKTKPDSVMSFMQIRCTKPAPQDIEVSLEIDESMVETYNTANGTDFKFLSSLELLKDNLVIRKGDYLSADTLKVRITEYDSMLAGGTQKYVVPVRMTSASAGVLSESNSFYIFYDAAMMFAEIVTSYTGVKMDRSGWKIYKDQIGGKDITSTLTDGSVYSDVYGSEYRGHEIVLYVDLGQVYDNITNIGVEAYGNYGQYSATNMKVEVSVDNVEYKDLGTYYTYPISPAILDLFEPQTARYIRITGYDPQSSYGWDIGEINVATAE